MPTRFWIAFSSSCIWRRSLRSSAPSGSSSSSTAGSTTSARASATRWRWPPESWCGLRCRTCSSPTSASASRAARRRSARADAPHQQPEADIAADAHMRETARSPGTPSRSGAGRAAWSCSRRRAIRTLPCARRQEAAEDRQQRRLARARTGRAARCSCRARSRARCRPAPGCAPKLCETAWISTSGSLTSAALLNSDELENQDQHDRHAEDQRADGIGLRVEAGAQQAPDLDRQGGVEPGEQEGDHELVPGEGHRQEEARRTAPATASAR